MLRREKAVVALMDVQGNLAHAMHRREQLFQNIRRMVQGATILGLPILWTEQTPDKLGRTVPEIAELLPDIHPMPKASFSCCGCAAFMEGLQALGRYEVLLTGIEAHVCVYQTAVDLLARQCRVDVVADAVSSRTADNRAIGLQRMSACGAGITSTETALFELLRTGDAPEFRQILSLIR